LGWSGCPFDEAVSHGPPCTRSDWILRGEDGCIYCTGPLPGPLPESLGRRLLVEAVVQLHAQGWPFLRQLKLQPLSGRAALCCFVSTDGFEYTPADTVLLRLLVRNDAQEPIKLLFPSAQTYDFRLLDSEGKVWWQWSRGRVFAQVVVERVLQPGEQYEIQERLPLGQVAGLQPGRYLVVGELPGNAQSYPHYIRVGEPR
jgi:hypothetical protein